MICVRVDPVTSQTWSKHNKTYGEGSKLTLSRPVSGGADGGVIPLVIPVLPTGCAPNGALFGVV